MSAASTPIPDRDLPMSFRETPASSPTSSKCPLPRLAKRKLGTLSLETNRSSQPSLLRSAATAPQALPSSRAIPDSLLTSVKVPSPLLWNSRLGAGEYALGMQYVRID